MDKHIKKATEYNQRLPESLSDWLRGSSICKPSQSSKPEHQDRAFDLQEDRLDDSSRLTVPESNAVR